MGPRFMTVALALVAGAAGAALTAATAGLAHGGSPDLVHSCVAKDGAVRLVGAPGYGNPSAVCDAGENAVDWAVRGPEGERGPQGERGLQGPPGPAGKSGSSDSDLPPVVWADRDRINGGNPDQWVTVLVVPLAARTTYTVWGRMGGATYLDCVLAVSGRTVAHGRQLVHGFGSITLFGIARTGGPTSLRLRCLTEPDYRYLNPFVMAVPIGSARETSGRMP